MTRKLSLVTLVRPALIALATSAAMTLAQSSTAFAQHGHRAPSSRGGGQSSGSGSSGGGSRASGGGQTTQGAPATASTPATHTGRSGHAVPREGTTSGSGGSASGGGTGGAVTRDKAGDTSGSGSKPVPPYSRPRDGRNATGDAVERRPNSTGGGGTTVIVPGGGYGGYYPWGYGGLGIGGYYGAGYYDPWWDDPYGYGYGGSSYGFGDDGALKLKVKPRDASVYVDGYFAGRVDDFDGMFQKLQIESGPHRVELRLDGYEPLTFEVRIQPDRTVTYTGELKKAP